MATWLHYLIFDPEKTQLVSRQRFNGSYGAGLSKRQKVKENKHRLCKEALSRSTLICLLISDDSLLSWVLAGKANIVAQLGFMVTVSFRLLCVMNLALGHD